MSQDEGYIKLSRRFFEHAFWKDRRVFDFADAWLDLIYMAAFADRKVLINGEMIEEPRGWVIHSVRFYCARWRWSNTKVLHFVDVLKKERMVTTAKRRGITAIYLCNFEKYNSQKRQENDTETTEKRQQNDGIEEGEEGEYNTGISLGTRLNGSLPALAEVLTYAGQLIPPCDPDYARKWFEEAESRGWVDRNKVPIRKWKPNLSAWWRGVQHNRAERKANGSHASFKEQDRQRETEIHKQKSKFGI